MEQLHRHNAGNPVIGRGAFRTSSGNNWRKPTKPTRSVILVGAGSLVFNCVAWSFYFPSHTEMVLWRFSSLAVLIGLFEVAKVSVVVATSGMDLPEWTSKLTRLIPPSWTNSPALDACGCLVASVGMVAYIVGRIMLIVLAFMQLRSLPPLAFHTVQWTTYIPHI